MMVANPAKVITPRQLELVALYASGYDFNQIGVIKFLTPSSVGQTLRLARERLGARNLTHLCIICLDSGLIVKTGRLDYSPVQEDRIVGE